MDCLNQKVECVVCGGTALYDNVEGFCPECGNAWIINEELFSERIAAEAGEEVYNEDDMR